MILVSITYCDKYDQVITKLDRICVITIFDVNTSHICVSRTSWCHNTWSYLCVNHVLWLSSCSSRRLLKCSWLNDVNFHPRVLFARNLTELWNAIISYFVCIYACKYVVPTIIFTSMFIVGMLAKYVTDAWSESSMKTLLCRYYCDSRVPGVKTLDFKSDIVVPIKL